MTENRIRWVIVLLTIGAWLGLAAPARAQMTQVRTPDNWVVLIWSSSLPTDVGESLRIRAAVLNPSDSSMAFPFGRMCGWHVLGEGTTLRRIRHACDDPGQHRLAPGDSVSVDITYELRAPGALQELTLLDQQGRVIFSGDGGGWALPSERVPFSVRLVRPEAVPVDLMEVVWLVQRGIRDAGPAFIGVLVDPVAASRMASTWPVLEIALTVESDTRYSISGCWVVDVQRGACDSVIMSARGLLSLGVDLSSTVQALMDGRPRLPGR